MRLWCLHPSYLDTKGLVACWREGLLARKVLQGQTVGYKNHPQLERFKAQPDPIATLDGYLLGIFEEAAQRGFSFQREKIGPHFSETKIPVTDGQINYELRHLQAKLKTRAVEQYQKIAALASPLPHPIFEVRKGDVETWERTSP
jgi:hypothetical protein